MDDASRPSQIATDRWQDRIARAATATADRPGDRDGEKTVRSMLDRGRAGAAIALAGLVLVGGMVGWATSREVFRPVDAPVNAAVAIVVLVGAPWLMVALRTLMLLSLGRSVGPWLGRAMPYGFVRATERQANDRRLGMAAARQLGALLAAGAGRHLASLGGAGFWCGYAAAAILAIWLSTARIAYGFGWESSWMSPEVGRDVVQTIAAPLRSFVDVDALAPIAASATSQGVDQDALDLRRRWIVLLSVAIGIYLLLPMMLWATWHAVRGHLAAARWRPPAPALETTDRAVSVPVHDPPVNAPTASLTACTHLVRIEVPDTHVPMPTSLAALADLGGLEDREDLERLRAAEPIRVAVIAWLPATPDRGVARRLDAVVAASTTPPVIILDGGHELRSREPERTVAARLSDWRRMAHDCGGDVVEFDLAAATESSLRLLDTAITGSISTAFELDPRLLDASFAVIGRGLETSPALPEPEAIATVASAIAELHDRDHEDNAAWIAKLRTHVATAMAGHELTPGDLRTFGTTLLPGTLRESALWMGLGGVLGVGACAAVATIAPVALAALPGWAGSGAGLGGVIGLARRLRSHRSSHDGDAANTEIRTGSQPDLGEAVLGLTTWSVLWWSQGGDETRTTRLLEALHDDTAPPPLLSDREDARQWLAAARQRLLESLE